MVLQVVVGSIEDSMPQWVMVFERIGPGSAILVFTGAVLWKLLPACLILLKAWKKQSDAITAAIPVAQSALTRIADNMERGIEAAMNVKFHEQPSKGH